MMKTKVALIGISGYGKTHLGQLCRLAKAGTIDLAAAVVRSPAKNPEGMNTLAELGTKILPDETALYGSGHYDLVCIPTGIPQHRPMLLRALEHGSNVLVEKPAAGCTADVLAMIEGEKAAAEKGLFAAVAFQNMYGRDVHAIKRTVLSGAIGKLKSVSVMGIWPRNTAYYTRNEWVARCHDGKGNAVFDSPANNAFAHHLNMALFYAGNDFASMGHVVSMRAELYRARPEIETFDTCSIQLRTSSDVRIQVNFTHAGSENHSPKIHLTGEHGSADWEQDGDWSVQDSSGRVLCAGKAVPPHNDMFDDVIRRISDPSVFTYTLSNAYEHTFCIEKLHESFTPVSIPEKDQFVREDDGQHVISGIADVFERCFREMILPSECGAVWAKPSAEVEIR